MKSLLVKTEKEILVGQSAQYYTKGSSVFQILMINSCTVNVNLSISKVKMDRFIIIFNFNCEYFAEVMLCHIWFLKTFAVKVSNLVTKKIKKNYRLMNKERQHKLEHFFIFSVLHIFIDPCIFTFIADIYFLCSTHFC